MKRIVLALILCGTMLWTACSTSWISSALQIVSVLIPATANLITLVATLQGKTVSAQDLQLIQSAGTQAGADLQLIQSLIEQYQKADDATKPGLLTKIQTGIKTVQDNLNNLLPALHIKDAATQAKITAVIGILLSEVESIAAIVPLVHPNASRAMVAMMTKQVRKQPPLSADEFVVSYNKVMTAKTGDANLDRATRSLAIHRHSAPVIFLSLGFAH